MYNKHILIVEDEAITRTKLVGYFQYSGYQVSEAENKDQMNEILKTNSIDLVMLDINLPGEDGLMITRNLRSKSTIGIILVTGRCDSIDKIIGLEMGADDYVTKPFELRELLARVKNVLWRISLAKQQEALPESIIETDDELFRFGECSFDIGKRKLLKNNVPIRLTKAEYDMLVAFVANPSRVMTRERLLNLIKHRVDTPNDRTIDVLVRRLRHKIENNAKDPQIFITVHGEGYFFVS